MAMLAGWNVQRPDRRCILVIDESFMFQLFLVEAQNKQEMCIKLNWYSGQPIKLVQ
jgi:hypothetical protein